MKARIYTDVSVLGGCEDEEFSEYSIRLLESFIRGDRILVLSNVTAGELRMAPDAVHRRIASIPEEHIEMLRLGHEARGLAEAYLAAEVLPSRMRADARHIAIATVGRVDVLVSWNFRHIVNLQRIRGYNSVNLREGISYD